MNAGIVFLVIIFIIAGFILLAYLIFTEEDHTSYDVRVVQVPVGTTLNSISDIQELCTSQGYQLATTNEISEIISKVGYTYCTRGYVDNTTIIPVSPNTTMTGCPNPGLNEMAAVFPCIQGPATSTIPSCSEVVFCLHGQFI